MKVTDINRDPNAKLVRYAANYAVWDRFTATVEPDDPTLPVCRLDVAVEGGRSVCAGLRAERGPAGEPITGTTLRQIPLKTYVDQAIGKAAMLAIPAPTGTKLFFRSDDGEETQAHAYRIDEEWVALPTVGLERSEQFQAEQRGTAGREHGARITDEVLRTVASLYRDALVAGKAPTAAVAEGLYVSRSTAGRYVQRARKRGFLRPARPRVAGEQGP